MRVFVITNMAVYNLGKGKTLKRRIEISMIDSVTQSSISDEFVLHIPSEYDYRLTAARKREAIEAIQTAKAEEAGGAAEVTVSTSSNVQLKEVTVTRVAAAASSSPRRGSSFPAALLSSAGGAGGSASAPKPSAGKPIGATEKRSSSRSFDTSVEIGDLKTISEADEEESDEDD